MINLQAGFGVSALQQHAEEPKNRMRGLYYNQWHHPAGKPERLRHAVGLDDIGPIDSEDAARAVFAVLEHHIAPAR